MDLKGTSSNSKKLYGSSFYPPMFDNEPPPLDDFNEGNNDEFADFSGFQGTESSYVDNTWNAWNDDKVEKINPESGFGDFSTVEGANSENKSELNDKIDDSLKTTLQKGGKYDDELYEENNRESGQKGIFGVFNDDGKFKKPESPEKPAKHISYEHQNNADNLKSANMTNHGNGEISQELCSQADDNKTSEDRINNYAHEQSSTFAVNGKYGCNDDEFGDFDSFSGFNDDHTHSVTQLSTIGRSVLNNAIIVNQDSDKAFQSSQIDDAQKQVPGHEEAINSPAMNIVGQHNDMDDFGDFSNVSSSSLGDSGMIHKTEISVNLDQKSSFHKSNNIELKETFCKADQTKFTNPTRNDDLKLIENVKQSGEITDLNLDHEKSEDEHLKSQKFNIENNADSFSNSAANSAAEDTYKRFSNEHEEQEKANKILISEGDGEFFTNEVGSRLISKEQTLVNDMFHDGTAADDEDEIFEDDRVINEEAIDKHVRFEVKHNDMSGDDGFRKSNDNSMKNDIFADFKAHDIEPEESQKPVVEKYANFDSSQFETSSKFQSTLETLTASTKSGKDDNDSSSNHFNTFIVHDNDIEWTAESENANHRIITTQHQNSIGPGEQFLSGREFINDNSIEQGNNMATDNDNDTEHVNEAKLDENHEPIRFQGTNKLSDAKSHFLGVVDSKDSIDVFGDFENHDNIEQLSIESQIPKQDIFKVNALSNEDQDSFHVAKNVDKPSTMPFKGTSEVVGQNSDDDDFGQFEDFAKAQVDRSNSQCATKRNPEDAGDDFSNFNDFQKSSTMTDLFEEKTGVSKNNNADDEFGQFGDFNLIATPSIQIEEKKDENTHITTSSSTVFQNLQNANDDNFSSECFKGENVIEDSFGNLATEADRTKSLQIENSNEKKGNGKSEIASISNDNEFDDFQEFSKGSASASLSLGGTVFERNEGEAGDNWASFSSAQKTDKNIKSVTNDDDYDDFATFTSSEDQQNKTEDSWAAFSSSSDFSVASSDTKVKSKADLVVKTDTGFTSLNSNASQNAPVINSNKASQHASSKLHLLLSPCFPHNTKPPVQKTSGYHSSIETYIEEAVNQGLSDTWSKLAGLEEAEETWNLSYNSSINFKWLLMTIRVSYEHPVKKWKHSSQDTQPSLSPTSSVSSFDVESALEPGGILMPEPAGKFNSLLKPTLLAQSQSKEVDLPRVPSISSLKKGDSGSETASETASLDLDFFAGGSLSQTNVALSTNKESGSDLFSLASDSISLESFSNLTMKNGNDKCGLQNEKNHSLPFDLAALNKTTTKQEISKQAQKFLDNLEDLRFMNSTVLMFPSNLSGN